MFQTHLSQSHNFSLYDYISYEIPPSVAFKWYIIHEHQVCSCGSTKNVVLPQGLKEYFVALKWVTVRETEHA